jgi:putative flavoprotein involved in K+ transport
MTSTDTDQQQGIAAHRHDVPTVVIGAGQAGLATAYHLQPRGEECLVLDAERRVGDQWRRRYASLRMNTPAQYDGLPGTPFPAPRHSFPTGREMGDYLERYVEEHGIAVLTDTPVERVERVGGRFLVTAAGTEILTDNVVVATGCEREPRVPGFAGELDPGIRQLHSSNYRDPSQLLPGPVLVVGCGQSGADLALESAVAGHETVLSGRVGAEIPVVLGSRRARLASPLLWFAAHHVLTTRTPVGRKARRAIRGGAGTPLLRVKRADLDAAGVYRTESRAVGVVDGRPQLDDGTVIDVANVLWCTGFRRDWSILAGLGPDVVGQDGWPREQIGASEAVAGLYFVGLLFQRGFYSMLTGGVSRDADLVARGIANRRGSAHGETSPSGALQ